MKFLKMMGDEGIGPDRLIITQKVQELELGKMPHLRTYHDIDIHLETWPYAGTTTTCECLWMGVPSLAMRAKDPPVHVCNVAVSLLTNIGHPEWVAEDQDDFVRK